MSPAALMLDAAAAYFTAKRHASTSASACDDPTCAHCRDLARAVHAAEMDFLCAFDRLADHRLQAR